MTLNKYRISYYTVTMVCEISLVTIAMKQGIEISTQLSLVLCRTRAPNENGTQYNSLAY